MYGMYEAVGVEPAGQIWGYFILRSMLFVSMPCCMMTSVCDLVARALLVTVSHTSLCSNCESWTILTPIGTVHRNKLIL